MVILVITKEGFKELESIIDTGKYPVWVSDGVLSDKDLKSAWERNIELTNFTHAINPNDNEAIDELLSIIADYHPAERVWLECVP